MAQTLTEIKALLAAHGLRPKHHHGQNFLHDHRKLDAILAAAEVTPGDLVLEVGPGTGALTERLFEAGARVLAVEIDTDLEPILRQRLGQRPGFALLLADVLAGKHQINPAVWDAMRALAGADQSPEVPKPPEPPFKLIANLPYNVASPLLANLVVDHPAMRLAVVMIQREVADRLTAPPGGKDYGPLGIIIQALCHVQRAAILPPSCFWPQPKVDSAVVALRRREEPLTDNPPRLSALLHRLFSKRRKQIGAILGRDTPLPPDIDPNDRPERLSVQQLVRLSATLPE